jgi:hypothetical protein
MSRGGFSVVMVLFLAFAACSAAPKDTLAGIWKTPEGDMTLRFSEDGTFTATAPKGETSGQYRYIEEEMLRMDFDDVSTQVGVSLVGERLTFCPEGHACDEFRRMK